MRAIEIVLHSRCNCRCLVCTAAAQDQTVAFAPDAVLTLLGWAREHGAREAAFGGGEPTLWHNLPWACRAARELGFDEVAVHTNGLVLAERSAAEALARAGASRVCLSLKGGTAETHDEMTRVPGAFERALAAAAEVRRAGLELEVDALVTSRSALELPTLVRRAAGLGAARASLWLVCLEPGQRETHGALMPRLAGLLEPLRAACRAAEEAGLPCRSHHLPACALGPHHRMSAPGWTLGVVVVEPGRAPFDLADSAWNRARFLAGCEGCDLDDCCPGVRGGLIAIHGEPEVPCPAVAPVRDRDPESRVSGRSGCAGTPEEATSRAAPDPREDEERRHGEPPRSPHVAQVAGPPRTASGPPGRPSPRPGRGRPYRAPKGPSPRSALGSMSAGSGATSARWPDGPASRANSPRRSSTRCSRRSCVRAASCRTPSSTRSASTGRGPPAAASPCPTATTTRRC